MMRRKVRILRHWKQRFHKDAEFIWRRSVIYAGESCKPGDPIPDILADNKTKLRRFWESGTIELAQFEDPNVLTGQVVRHTAAKDMVRELAHQQTEAQARVMAEAAAAIAVDDFAETEDEEFSPDSAEDWLGESESVA